MTRSTFNKKQKRRALMALGLACVTSFSMCLFTACDDDDSNKDSSSTTKTDTGLISNGNFEYYTDDSNLKLIVTPSGWTNSVGTDKNSDSASSSAAKSGIINTESSVWKDMTTSSYTPTNVKDAEKNWENMTAKDRLAFYDRIEDLEFEDSDDIDSLSDFSEYSDYAYSIKTDDIPACENPGTHDKGVYTATGDDDTTETSVLMIHNYRTDGYGTAQKYTSSTTVTIEANTAAKFSVWVKTSDLKYNNGLDVNANRGAYIGVTHTVGGTTLDQFQIKNINTEGVTENNGWVQYTVYLKGCSYASSTFNIVLGLGQGSTKQRYEYVSGYAFFDDIECEKMTTADYDEQIAKEGVVPTCTLFTDETDKLYATDKAYANNYVYAIDFYQGFNRIDFLPDTAFSVELTKETYNNVSYTTSNYKGLGLPTANDVTVMNTVSELQKINNSYLKSILKNDFSAFPFESDENVIMLMSADGAAYTATLKSDIFSVEPDEYKMVSFWTKTSALNGYTGATIALVDGDSKSTIGAIDSTVAETVEIGDNDDLFDGWVQCFFFVQNETEETHDFHLTFSYGPTTITGTTKASYLEGYAAFTGFETYDMNSEEFAYASAGTYAVSVSLTGNTEDTTSKGFDSAIYSNTDAIKEGLATPLNYLGVDGGSSYVGGEDYSYVNSNKNSGLVNKAYKENYSANYEKDNWLGHLLSAAGYKDISLTTALSTSSWWNDLFGTSTQPLLIVNAIEQSYGYIAKSNSTISSSAYSAITVNVQVSKGAIAYIYLIDTSDLKKGYNKNLALSTPEVTYWYDDDGNICKKDPSDDDYNKRTDVVYYLNTNGLYESSNKSDSKLYANLAAYQTAYEYDSHTYSEESDAGKNLVTDNGSIVYYYHDGAYYAQYDETKDAYLKQVNDLDHSYARYTKETRELYTVIDNRNGQLSDGWKQVAFYVATGNKSKNYRLEVFSGSRDGSVKSLAGSYVAFDAITPGTLSDSYEGLLEEAIDNIDKADNGVKLDKETGRLVYENGTTYDKASYYTFTFYDSATYTRYDEEADPTNDYVIYEDETDDPGNLYSSYQQSSYEEQLIYLEYNTEDKYTTFVNYSPINTAVSANSAADSDEDEDEDSEFDGELFMMVMSIVLSAVLIFTMLCLLARRIIKYFRRKNVNKDNAYSAKRRHYAKKLKIAPSEIEKDENDPYGGQNN